MEIFCFFLQVSCASRRGFLVRFRQDPIKGSRSNPVKDHMESILKENSSCASSLKKSLTRNLMLQCNTLSLHFLSEMRGGGGGGGGRGGGEEGGGGGGGGGLLHE